MTPANPPSLTARMRGCIAAEHEAIEQTPFSIQMMTGTLTREIYALNLAQMFHIHSSIESLAAAASEMQPFFSAEMERAAVAARDLNSLGFDVDDFEVLPETTQCIDSIEKSAAESPMSLIGGIYVLEGSRMGSLVLAKPLAKCLQISGAPQSGVDYHIAGAGEVRGRLKIWKEAVDGSPFDYKTSECIVAFARTFMIGLLEIYRAMPIKIEAAQRDVA